MTDYVEKNSQYTQAKPSTNVKSFMIKPSQQHIGIQVQVKDKKPTVIEQLKRMTMNNKQNNIKNVLNSTEDSVSSSVFDSSFSTQTSTTSSDDPDLLKNKKELLKKNMYLNFAKIIIEDDPLLLNVYT